jgi:hypothetical protein
MGKILARIISVFHVTFFKFQQIFSNQIAFHVNIDQLYKLNLYHFNVYYILKSTNMIKTQSFNLKQCLRFQKSTR